MPDCAACAGQKVFGRPPVNSVQAETEEERRVSEFVFMHQSIPCAPDLSFLLFIFLFLSFMFLADSSGFMPSCHEGMPAGACDAAPCTTCCQALQLLTAAVAVPCRNAHLVQQA